MLHSLTDESFFTVITHKDGQSNLWSSGLAGRITGAVAQACSLACTRISSACKAMVNLVWRNCFLLVSTIYLHVHQIDSPKLALLSASAERWWQCWKGRRRYGSLPYKVMSEFVIDDGAVDVSRSISHFSVSNKLSNISSSWCWYCHWCLLTINPIDIVGTEEK